MANHGSNGIHGLTLEGHTGIVWSTAISQDGLLAVTGSSDTSAIVWDLRGCFPLQKLTGHTERVVSCAISGDAKRVATASADGTVRLWEVMTGNCVSTIRSNEPSLDIAYDCWLSADGSLFSAVFGKKWEQKVEFILSRWRADNTVTSWVSSILSASVRKISVLPASRLVAFTTSENMAYSRSAEIFNFLTWERHRSSALTDSLYDRAGISFAANAPAVVVADNESLFVLHPHSPRKDVRIPVHNPYRLNTPCAINANGTRILASTGYSSFSMWNVNTKTVVASFDRPASKAYCCAISSDGKTVLIGGESGVLNVYEVSTDIETRAARKAIEVARDWFKNRAPVFISPERAMEELNCLFENLRFEKFDDDRLASAIDSVLSEDDDVFLSEDHFVQVFYKLRRHAIRLANMDEPREELTDIGKARERWAVVFDRAAGPKDDATLRIDVTAWRLIKQIHDKSRNTWHGMRKEVALEFLRSCVEESRHTIFREEFLDAAEKACAHVEDEAVDEDESEDVDDERDFCVFDQADIEIGQRVVRLPCTHLFHADCLLPYLRREESPLCPLDRTPVDRDVIPNLPVWYLGTE